MSARARAVPLAGPNRVGRHRSILEGLPSRPLTGQRVGELLGEWQRQELWKLRQAPECHRLSHDELADLYQDTVVELLDGHFREPGHLRNALRVGVRFRALKLYRDNQRHAATLAKAARLELRASSRQSEDSPEQAVVVQEDRLIVREFLAELTADERQVFWMLSEGLGRTSIATALKIDKNAARRIQRECERKRAAFQLMYATGRVCGYRADTIEALLAGERPTAELAAQAFAHLEVCRACRAAHKTNGRRLWRAFQDQAAILLPLPASLYRHVGWLGRLGLRARIAQHRLALLGLDTWGETRERMAAVIAAAGLGAKMATGAATIGVVAAGVVGIGHVVRGNSGTAQAAPSSARAAERLTTPLEARALFTPVPRTDVSPRGRATPGHLVRGRRPARHKRHHKEPRQLEPGGFAYLGVPEPRHVTTTEPVRPAQPRQEVQQSESENGGPFSP